MKIEKNIFSSLFGAGETNFRERKSNFSLEFSAFGPSVLVGPRSKLDLRCKGYAWTPILWSFDNSGRYRSSPTRFIFGLRAIKMVLIV